MAKASVTGPHLLPHQSVIAAMRLLLTMGRCIDIRILSGVLKIALRHIRGKMCMRHAMNFSRIISGVLVWLFKLHALIFDPLLEFFG